MVAIGSSRITWRRNVRPSMRGISMSRISTSGRSPRIFCWANRGSGAVAMTAMSGCPESISLSMERTTAESSTIITLIMRKSCSARRAGGRPRA